MIFSGDGLTTGPITEWPQDFNPPFLGSAAEIRETISRVWPDTDWSDPAWGWFDSPELATEINFQPDGEVQEFMLHVRGGTDPVPAILRLATKVGAIALDTSTGERLALDTAPSGYPAWVRFRDRVVHDGRDSKDP